MKIFLKIFGALFFISVLIFFLYFNNTSLVNSKTVYFYNQLKDSLRSNGYAPRLLVISTKRFKFHNDIQVKFAGAASKSRHLSGEALDFLVFDVNKDGIINSLDLDVVFQILDKKIIRNNGGIGTYKNEHSFFNRQMIHIDCRGYKARWN
jgi:uncharacterized protein YcbK (DUF882 family)